MSIDETDSTDDTGLLRPDAVARVDEPEEFLYPAGDEPDEADEAHAPPASPYPDGPGGGYGADSGTGPGGGYGADSGTGPGGGYGADSGTGAASPYPDGWGPGGAGQGQPYPGAAPSHVPGSYLSPQAAYLPQGYTDPYPQGVKQYDPSVDFEPPDDLPPWYEDEYYDDRDWERMPRSTSTLFRVLIFVAGFVVVLAISGFYVKGWVDDQLDPPGEEGASVVIEIPQGATTNDIARILHDEGVVANGTVFRYYLRYKDAGDFQAGEYTFRTNMAVWDVRDTLDAGARVAESFFVTIPEGLRLTEIQATLVSRLPRFDAGELNDAFSTVRKPTIFGDSILFSSEGILFPDTYEIAETGLDNEQALLERMVTRFDQVAAEVDLVGGAERLGLSPYQVLIVASLIEEEARADADRAKIARVIYNRLENDWMLGIDATVVYALGGDRQLSASDLDTDSPYNTRKFIGLPPTPIASPGRASLEAAVNPEEGDWFYYVLTEEDGPGTHTFAETEAEFVEAVQICIERNLGCG